MPVAQVQTPDGRVMHLEVPEGATEQQILDFAQQQFQVQKGPPIPAPGPDPLGQGTTLADTGVVGVVPESFRRGVQKRVEAMPFVEQLITEASPALIGTVLGGAAGSIGGPPGAIAGAMAGGGLGELVGQEAGVAPRSDVALGISAAAPVVGPALGGATKRLIRMLPQVRQAGAELAERGAATELGESFGTQVLARQKGLRARSADELFEATRRFDAPVAVGKFQETGKALQELRAELAPLRSFPEARAAIRVIDQTTETLTQGAEIPFSAIVDLRQQLGALVGKAERAGGKRLGTAKKAFSALADDMEGLTTEGGRVGRLAKIGSAANERFKLEASVRELEEAVVQRLQPVPGEDAAALNVRSLRKWLADVTNPKSKNFNKNFTTALGEEAVNLDQRLKELTKFAAEKGPKGPGGLIVAGITAGAGAGMGGMVAGPAGATVGALIGVSTPRMLTGLLLSKPGAALLRRVTGQTRGTITTQVLASISQAIAQSASRPVAGPGPSFAVNP